MPISKLWCRMSGFPKWSIKSRGVLCGVRHYSYTLKPVFIEYLSYYTDTPIHHIRWSYYVRPCFCMGECHPSQILKCLIIFYLTIFYNSAVAVACIFAHADISLPYFLA